MKNWESKEKVAMVTQTSPEHAHTGDSCKGREVSDPD